MPEELAIDDPQAGEPARDREPRRGAGFPGVTFGLSAAALAGIVVAACPAAASAATGPSAAAAVAAASTATAASPGDAINQLVPTHTTCSGSGGGPSK